MKAILREKKPLYLETIFIKKLGSRDSYDLKRKLSQSKLVAILVFTLFIHLYLLFIMRIEQLYSGNSCINSNMYECINCHCNSRKYYGIFRKKYQLKK